MAKYPKLLGAAAIAAACLWVYQPAWKGDWVRDDVVEIVNNPVLRDPPGRLWRIWFAPVGPDYFPLKTTLQWVEWHLWGPNLFGDHLVNLFLHLAGALILWRLLEEIYTSAGSASARSSAWIGGLLFAVHPLAVESAAWISELKNVMSLPPLLLAGLAFVRYCEREESGRRRKAYLGALIGFAASLLCKTSGAMFPVALLLYCWWRRSRISREDLLRTAPFFALSLGLGLVTIAFQQQRAIGGADLGLGGLLSQAAAAGISLVFYGCKFLVPLRLLPAYPRWIVAPPSWAEFLPWALLAALLTCLLARERSADWRRHAVLGLGFFALNLIPVLGFVPMAYARTAWAADHLAYLPMVGLVGLFGAGIGWTAARARIAWLPFLAVLACLAVAGRNYAGAFANEESLWTYTLRRFPGSWVAHNDLGLALARAGRRLAALEQQRQAWALNPGSAIVNYDYANALAAAGRPKEAITRYERALELNPKYIEARVNLGNTRLRIGQPAEAIRQLREAAEENDRVPEIHYNLANALAALGETSAAIEEYGRALELRPDYFSAEYRLANALGNAGRVREALQHYEKAVKIDPRSSEARANLGLALVNLDRLDEAVAALNEAAALDPKSAEARAYLGLALMKLGRAPEAVADYEKAVALAPNWSDAHYQLGVALRSLGRVEEANREFALASRLDARPGEP